MNQAVPASRPLPLRTLALALASGAWALAQTATTGALEGRVVDTSGRPVAGARITAESAQVTRVAVTDARGRYRLLLLDPGTWRVAMDKGGHLALSLAIPAEVGPGATTRLGFTTTTASNYRITQGSPGAPKPGAQVSRLDPRRPLSALALRMDEALDLPGSRSLSGLLLLAPGTSTSGPDATRPMDRLLAGGTGAQLRLDGIRLLDPVTGASPVDLEPEFLDAVLAAGAGRGAEDPVAGGLVDAGTRVGSNTFGGALWAGAAPSLPKPKRTPYRSDGREGMAFDGGARVGGALLPGSLFYGVGLAIRQGSAPPQANLGGVPLGRLERSGTQMTGKARWFPDAEQQVSLGWLSTKGTRNQGTSSTPLWVADGHGTSQGGAQRSTSAGAFSLEWRRALGPGLAFTVRAGQTSLQDGVAPLDTSTPLVLDRLWYGAGGGQPGALAPGTTYARGGYGRYVASESRTTQLGGDLLWTRGGHALEGGVSTLQASGDLHEHLTGGRLVVLTTGPSGGNLLLERFQSNDAHASASLLAFHLQDAWRASDSLTLSAGLRAQSQVQKDGSGRTLLSFGLGQGLQPRASLVHASGASRSWLSWSRTAEWVPLAIGLRGTRTSYQNLFGDGVPSTTFDYRPDAANLTGPTGGNPAVRDFGRPFNHPAVADGLLAPMREELQWGWERLVTPSLTVGVQGSRARLLHPVVASVITTPADGAVLWNPAPGPVSWTSGSTRFSLPRTAFPEASATWQSLGASLAYRRPNAFLLASYTWSSLKGTYDAEGLAQEDPDQGTGPSPWDQAASVGSGTLSRDRTHLFKAAGWQRFKALGLGLTGAFRLTWQSGLALTRYEALGTDPASVGTLVPAQGRLGAMGRTPGLATLGLSLACDLAVTAGIRAQPRLEVDNALNARPATTAIQEAVDAASAPAPSDRWGSAASWPERQSIRVSLKVTF